MLLFILCDVLLLLLLLLCTVEVIVSLLAADYECWDATADE